MAAVTGRRLLGVLVYVCVLGQSVLGNTDCDKQKDGKLLLILLDGVRWDQLSREDLLGFKKLREEGVSVERLTPVFPSNSLSNYYSIATGLWPESNGMLDNFMYDQEHDMYFRIGDQESDFRSFWWDDAEPIWITATRQGRRVHMYNWVGCEAVIQGLTPALCRKYVGKTPLSNFSAELMTSLELMRTDSIDMAGVYEVVTDSVSHTHGPESQEVLETTQEVDSIMQDMLDWMDQTNSTTGCRMADLVDIMITSDHGMTPLPPNNFVSLADYVDTTAIQWEMIQSPIGQLWPYEGRLEEVYANLSVLDHMSVYRKSDIPERYHFRHHRRVPPILIVADLGWRIGKIGEPSNPVSTILGTHGYDPKHVDLGAVFLARGPSFERGVTQGPIVNIELYQMFCRILNITPRPHNGTWFHVSAMMSRTEEAASVSVCSLLLGLFIAISQFSR